MEDYNKSEKEETSSILDMVNVLRDNAAAVFLITISCIFVAGIYALNSIDVYRATTSIKINKPQGSILEAPMLPEFQEFGSDRFIANEIEILKSYSISDRVAAALKDSAKIYGTDSFYLIINIKDAPASGRRLLPKEDIIKILEDRVTIEQKRGLDIIEVSAESASAFEAAMISNCYANEYRKLNLEINRNQLTIVKDFLYEQKTEKLQQLNQAEELLRKFQESGGVVSLDVQASSLISQLSTFEAQKNAVEIELMATEKVLSEYKDELEAQNPKLADYLESSASEVYIKNLQEQIAKLQVNIDLANASKNTKIDNSKLIADNTRKIDELNEKLEQRMNVIKAGIFASSPEEVKELSKKVIEQKVKHQSLLISLAELEKLVVRYEEEFNTLPRTAIELARYQRNMESLEKLYVLVEEKYQEALINEQSQPGNVFVIDKARRTYKAHKPNRLLIIIVGLVLGTAISFGYVFIRNSFDRTVKNPEDIKKSNISVLGWIPTIDGVGVNGNSDYEFIVSRKPDSIASEAFRALRTRVRYSNINSARIKTILITSSAPQEGKTTVCINLAGAFAQSKNRTLLVDCDLRKPRIHSIFKSDKTPGLVDYLLGYVSFDKIVKQTGEEHLDYIPSGTIPSNPSEILESAEMSEFLQVIKTKYDIIILDSAPVIPVTDTEILAKKVDASLLLVSAGTTENDLMKKSVELLQSGNSSFLGTILNNFGYKAGYGKSYYKYYYYYTEPLNKKSSSSIKDKKIYKK